MSNTTVQTFTLSAEKQHTHESNSSKEPPAFQSVYTDDHIFQLIYGTSTGLGIVFANLIVIYGFSSIRRKSFSNYLFLSIAISDLINGLTQSPFATMTKVYVRWPFGNYLCYSGLVVSGVGYLVSNYMLLILAYHRYSLITRPFRYDEKINQRRETLVIGVWLASLAYKIVTATYHIVRGRVNLQECLIQYDGVYIVIQNFSMNISPTTAAVVINMLNICQLLKTAGNRFSSAEKSLIRLIPMAKAGMENSISESDSTLNKANQSLTAVKYSSCKSGSDHQLKHVQSSADAISSTLLARRRLDKNKKAVLCISFLILNSILTEYFFLIVYPYVYFCSCKFYLLKYSMVVLRLFPLINPVLVFLFHESFRIALCQRIMAKNKQPKPIFF